MFGHVAQRQHAALASLPLPDGDESAVRIDVVDVEAGQLAAAQTGGVKELQHATITDAENVARVGRRHECRDFVGAQGFRQSLGRLAWEFQVGGGIGGKMVLLAEPAEEPLQGSEPVALGRHAERFPVLLAVVEEMTLVAFQNRLGDRRGVDQVAILTPAQKVTQTPARLVEGSLGVGAFFEAVEPRVGQARERVGRGTVEAVGRRFGAASLPAVPHSGDVVVSFLLLGHWSGVGLCLGSRCAVRTGDQVRAGGPPDNGWHLVPRR